MDFAAVELFGSALGLPSLTSWVLVYGIEVGKHKTDTSLRTTHVYLTEVHYTSKKAI